MRTDLVEGRTTSRRATWLQLPRFPTPNGNVPAFPQTDFNGNVPAFPQTDFHLWRNGNLHFTLYLKGHGDSHTRKIGKPPIPVYARKIWLSKMAPRKRLRGAIFDNLRSLTTPRSSPPPACSDKRGSCKTFFNGLVERVDLDAGMSQVAHGAD